MSWITDVLLLLSNEETLAIREIQAWLVERSFSPLERLDGSMAAGLGKVSTARVLGRTYNHFPMKEFVAFVRSRHWNQPANVRLLLKDEDESAFRVELVGDR